MNPQKLWTEKEKEMYQKMLHAPKSREKRDHDTASSFVMSKDLKYVLFIYHKKYDSWSWMGGHWEKGETLIETAIRELYEESGVRANPISTIPISIEKLWALDHYHYNQTFLFLVDKNTPLTLNHEETNGVRWIAVKELNRWVTEKHILPLYEQLIERAKKLNTSK